MSKFAEQEIWMICVKYFSRFLNDLGYLLNLSDQGIHDDQNYSSDVGSRCHRSPGYPEGWNVSLIMTHMTWQICATWMAWMINLIATFYANFGPGSQKNSDIIWLQGWFPLLKVFFLNYELWYQNNAIYVVLSYKRNPSKTSESVAKKSKKNVIFSILTFLKWEDSLVW